MCLINWVFFFSIFILIDWILTAEDGIGKCQKENVCNMGNIGGEGKGNGDASGSATQGVGCCAYTKEKRAEIGWPKLGPYGRGCSRPMNPICRWSDQVLTTDAIGRPLGQKSRRGRGWCRCGAASGGSAPRPGATGAVL